MNQIASPFALTEAERRNPLWLKLVGHFEQRLRDLRGKNDGPLDPAETASIRGQIQTLKSIIALGDEPPHDG